MDSRTQELLVQPAAAQEALLGELRALLDQLGAAENLINLQAAADALACPAVPNWEVFREFIAAYKTRVLYAHELNAIYRACLHARANESRELVELDRQLGQLSSLRPFASASRHVGRTQLNWLAPLRGERVVAKYQAAVNDGKAQGWHTLVYGLTLAVYSIPARQGLVGYATQILRRYIDAAGRAFAVTEAERAKLLENLCADLPQQVDAVVSAGVIPA